MPAAKRSAEPVATSTAAKRSKRTRPATAVQAQLSPCPSVATEVSCPMKEKTDMIAEVIMLANDLPLLARQMLCSNLPASLGAPFEERHAYQEQVNDMIDETLQSVWRCMKKQAEAAEKTVNDLEVLKGQAESESRAAKQDFMEKACVVTSKKVACSESEQVMQTSSETQSEAEAALHAFEAELSRVNVTRTALERCFCDIFLPLKNGSVEPSKAAAHMREIKSIAEEFEFCSSILTSIPVALSRSVEQRGVFDTVVFEHVEEEFLKRIAAAKASCAGIEDANKERLARQEEAKVACSAAAEVCEVAQLEVKQVEVALKASAKRLKDVAQELEDAQEVLEAERVGLQTLEDGALASFKELRVRSLAPLMPPSLPESSPSQIATPQIDEAVVTSGVELELARAATTSPPHQAEHAPLIPSSNMSEKAMVIETVATSPITVALPPKAEVAPATQVAQAGA
eukprot:TRINITY_DN17215_c0_g2_i1.p1 TRINITY_DN17215_c0_g2~~TRINITY_DN17215_c0_g2_i1.p1  ORF type:complete len:511 (-),score=127.49 TRINITY_DN17215_c0_g2_i1:451-1824(-)